MDSNTEIILNAINSTEKRITEKLDNMNYNMKNMSLLLEAILNEIKKLNEKRKNSDQFEFSKSESNKQRVPEDNKSSKRSSEKNKNIRNKLFNKASKKTNSIKKEIYFFQFEKR